MEDMANLDRVLGGVAIAFLLGGMLMLLGGVSSLDDGKDKRDAKNKGKASSQDKT